MHQHAVRGFRGADSSPQGDRSRLYRFAPPGVAVPAGVRGCQGCCQHDCLSRYFECGVAGYPNSVERREVDGRVPLLRVHRSIRRHGAFHGYRTRGEKGTFPVMTAAIDAIKQTLEKVKGVRGLARKLADDADIIATVGLDSLEMLRFMLDIEERL